MPFSGPILHAAAWGSASSGRQLAQPGDLLIAISGSKHIIAGSVEAFLLLVSGQIGFGQMLVGFTIPVLFGNVIGGTALFALISYAQVMREI